MKNEDMARPTDQALVNEAPAGLPPTGFDPSREAALIRCIQAVCFYAIPENWHGVYMCGHGPMTDDWSEVKDAQYPDGKPGKLARDTVNWLIENGFADDDALATEAGTAETENTGSVHEGAVPKGDAQ